MTQMGLRDFLFPKTVFNKHSEFNGDVKVIKVLGTTKLIFGGGVQSLKYDSPGIEKQYWGMAAKLITTEVGTARSILVLGLGGGTIQKFLAQAFRNATITSVEIDPVVIEAARKHFDLGAIPNHTILQADCFEVLKNPLAFGIKSIFDVILVDINEAGLITKVPEHPDYFSQLSDMLLPKGLVVFNFLVSKENAEKGHQLKSLVEKYFSEVRVELVKNPALADNWIIFGRKL